MTNLHRLGSGLLAALIFATATSGMAQPARGAAEGAASRPEAREIRWEELMPKDWDPYKELRELGEGNVVDGSPEALQRMRDLRRIWDDAPTNKALDGQAIKLPGYVVPLEESKDGLKEFLLVPYFGACIHSPPPPSNQIIHVVAAKPVKGFSAMDTVWVTGTLSLARQESEMGVSGYRIAAASIVRYVPPAR
ncbi:DUF3299 domain-containing protein [Piscinibacter sp. HJYY11]|uniref:DUF3299 domain-containing protein n=1 Tax=Piscinibacter sp. HJYY11 TaxID=2801333 RepID=UPI00191D98B1|nr:DUF3299 domain-containing protein [Piscinibacter sp. HJYY11]MBL0726435.1 DUF3299 domain-containing protein [Piscinibacter sp. HJYY11]